MVSEPRVGLAASVKPLVVEPFSRQDLETVRGAIARLDPDAARQLPSISAVPAPQNAASDVIVAGYQFIQFWVDYGVNLADYVLGFIPYGYLIGDQISIVYYSLIRPIADSVTYSLIVPVVNDPLNVWSYINGVIAVGQASVNALINTGINEFYYFFGWLIPPLPIAAKVAPMDITEVDIEAETGAPALDTTTDLVTAVATGDEHVDGVAETDPTEPLTTEVTDELASTEPTTEPIAPEPEVQTETAATTTSSGGVQAQGEVRSGSQTTVTDPAPAAVPAGAEGPGDEIPVAEPTAAGAVEDKDKEEPADGPAGAVQSESPDSGASDANAA